MRWDDESADKRKTRVHRDPAGKGWVVQVWEEVTLQWVNVTSPRVSRRDARQEGLARGVRRKEGD